MNKSLEALDELSLMINREKHINSEWNKKINDLKQTIKQDLERLKHLEEKNQELKTKGKALVKDFRKAIDVAKKLKKENKELKENEIEINRYNSQLMAMAIRLRNENKELKKKLENNNYNYDDETGWGTI